MDALFDAMMAADYSDLVKRFDAVHQEHELRKADNAYLNTQFIDPALTDDLDGEPWTWGMGV